jgi:hypothetical protein
MPVNACREIVGASSSPSLINSMVNSYLHVTLAWDELLIALETEPLITTIDDLS